MASVKPRQWRKPDGSTGRGYEVRYIDPETGRRPSRTFALKKDADAYKRKVEREIEDGLHVAEATTRPLSGVIAEYMTHTSMRRKDGRIGQSHYVRQETVCRLYLLPAVGTIPAKSLTMMSVASLYRSMVERGLHPQTAKQYLQTFQMIEQFARKRGWMKTQPVTDALSDLRGLPAQRVQTFEASEVTKLLAAASNGHKGVSRRGAAFRECAIALAALAGMRLGEILALRRRDVDLERRLIQVRQNLTKFGEIKGPKTAAGRRDVPLASRAATALQRWLDLYAVDNDRGLLFTAPNGNAFADANVRTAWCRLLTREAVAPRHFHALRHFYASWLLKHGMPVADVSKMLGHSSHEMTLRVYTHAMMDNAEATARVDQITALLPAIAAPMTQRQLSV